MNIPASGAGGWFVYFAIPAAYSSAIKL